MPQMTNNDPSSFGWSGWGAQPDGSTARVVPFSYNGVSFPAGIADILVPQATYLLSHIVPMINGGLDTHDYGNGLTGNYGFENRDIRQSPGVRSFHSYGIAVDVDAVQNGQGTSYGTGPLRIPAAAGAFAQSLGWLCGGDFQGITDPMHFECHSTPAEVLAWNATHTGTSVPVTPPNDWGNMDQATFNALMDAWLKTVTVPMAFGAADATPPAPILGAIGQTAREGHATWQRVANLNARP